MCIKWLIYIIYLVSVVPSPQWLYEQIHALPDSDTTKLHAKKSNIPDVKNHVLPHKRKDGVKRLFNFLDSAIQESGSGSGDSSGQEQHTGSNGLTGKHSVGVAGFKQKVTTSLRGPTLQSSEAQRDAVDPAVDDVHQVSSHKDRARLSGSSRQVSTRGLYAGSNPQSTQAINKYTNPDQQGVKRVAVAVVQRTADYLPKANPQSLTCK